MPSIPELEAQLNNAIDQRTKVDILNQIAWAQNLEDPEKARTLAEQAYELASSGEFDKEPYTLGLAGSLRSLAALNNDAGNYDMALSQSLRALEMIDGVSDNPLEANPLRLDLFGVVSWTYRSYGDYEIATEYGMKALEIAQTMEDPRCEAAILNILSVILLVRSNFDG